MVNLNGNGLLRLEQILGNAKKDIPALIPIGRTAWWMGVKAGRYPQPVKLGERTRAWRAADIRKLIEEGEIGSEQSDLV
jgi:prophage regulatory protein